MTDNDRPFLYYGGRYFDTITVRHNKPAGNTLDGIPYQIDFGYGSLSISPKDFDALAESIVRTLYDTNALSMDTAERLAYFANAVLADAVPTCDICGISEEASPLTWNGETGNHHFCEQQISDKPLFGGDEPVIDHAVIADGWAVDTDDDDTQHPSWDEIERMR